MTCYERIVWFFQITLAVKKNEYSTSFPRTPFEFILEKKKSREIRTLPCIVRWLITPFKPIEHSGGRKNASNTFFFFSSFF